MLSILTRDLLAPVTRQHMSWLFVPTVRAVVFSLQINRSRVVMKSRLDHLLKAVWTQLFCSTSECDCCVHICLNRPSQKGNPPPCFRTMSSVEPSVKVSLVLGNLIFLIFIVSAHSLLFSVVLF